MKNYIVLIQLPINSPIFVLECLTGVDTHYEVWRIVPTEWLIYKLNKPDNWKRWWHKSKPVSNLQLMITALAHVLSSVFTLCQICQCTIRLVESFSSNCVKCLQVACKSVTDYVFCDCLNNLLARFLLLFLSHSADVASFGLCANVDSLFTWTNERNIW